MDRRTFLGTLAGGLLAAPLPPDAQPPASTTRIAGPGGLAMTLQLASGSFVTPTTTGNFTVKYVDPSGATFVGKVLILWGGGHPSALGHHKDVDLAMGFAVSSTQQCTTGCASDDLGMGFHSRGTPGDCSDCSQNWHPSGFCYAEARAPIGNVGQGYRVRGAFVTWANGSFTINWTTVSNPATRIFYWVLGGSDLESAHVGVTNVPPYDPRSDTPTPVTHTQTGLPFTPTLLFALHDHIGGITGTTQRGGFSLALATATTAWGLHSSSVDDLPTTAHSRCGLVSTRFIYNYLSATGASSGRSGQIETEWNGFLTNGFSLKVYRCHPNSTPFMTLGFLALKGSLQATLGTFQQRTTVGTQDVTTPFTPASVFFASRGWLPDTDMSTHGKVGHHGCIGLALSASNQRVTSWDQPFNNAAPLVTETAGSEAGCLRIIKCGASPSLGTVRSRASLSSFPPNAFRLSWDEINVETQIYRNGWKLNPPAPVSVDATARDYAYLALAPGDGAQSPRPRSRRSSRQSRPRKLA